MVRARSLTRVVEASRWSAAAVLGVLGTPSHPSPVTDEGPDAHLEDSERPHEDLDAPLQEAESAQEVMD